MIRLAVRCPRDAAEVVLAELLELAPGGVEQDEGRGWVEYAIYGAAGELPDLGSLEAVAGSDRISVRSEEVPNDWADRWRDFHEPVWIADRIVIRPSWIEIDRDAEVSVVVDPGHAFGTGAHPTTRMCVGMLLELADRGEASGSLVDLGTGSGVLAIVAAKLGFGPVLAVDHEQGAVETARANAEANSADIDVDRIDLRESPPPLAKTMVSNLTGPLLLDLAERVRAEGDDRRPRNWLCSGVLAREAAAVAGAFGELGLTAVARRSSGDWAALRFAAS